MIPLGFRKIEFLSSEKDRTSRQLFNSVSYEIHNLCVITTCTILKLWDYHSGRSLGFVENEGEVFSDSNKFPDALWWLGWQQVHQFTIANLVCYWSIGLVVFSESCLNLFLCLPIQRWWAPQTSKFAISAVSGLEAGGFLAVWTGRSHRGTPLGAGKS